MAYVRPRGSQVLIVHGARDPETRKVEQRILFTIYSRAEALEVLGRRGKDSSRYFRELLQDQYPDIRFDWKRIRAGIREQMDVLPDLYAYRTTRLHGRFRQDLAAFVKQLVLADPQELASAAALIRDHREELGYVADLIQARLDYREPEERSFGMDNHFYWRLALHGSDVPPLAEEHAVGYYERGELDRAEAVFKLLVEAFDRYAEGYNYLGLIALDHGELDAAIEHFEKTVEVGRKLFPGHIGKSRYWSDLATRPYVRGLNNLVLTLNRAGRYDEALPVCERLDKECGDDFSAVSHRAAIYVNTGLWRAALDAAEKLQNVDPGESLTAAFACYELDHREDAAAQFLHFVLNLPGAAQRMFKKGRWMEPKEYEDIRDHNTAVGLQESLGGYWTGPGKKSRKFFKGILDKRKTRLLIGQLNGLEHERKNGKGDARQKANARLEEMRSVKFARDLAKRMALVS